MAFYKVTKKLGFSDAIPVFENGEFKNPSLFSHEYGATGGTPTIVDDCIVFGNYTVVGNSGIRFDINSSDKYTLIINFESTATAYAQVGVCNKNADAASCLNTGAGRLAYTGDTLSTEGIIVTGTIGNTSPNSTSIYIAGNSLKIKSIYCVFGTPFITGR